MRTIREISAGGVVYRRHGGVPQVILIRVGKRWSLPKGRVEEGEGLQETAIREVMEETGLEGRVVTKLKDITYWYMNETRYGEKVRIFKRVYFYLIRCLRGDVRRHDKEIDEAKWLPISEAFKKLRYPAERETMRMAETLIEDKDMGSSAATRELIRKRRRR